MAGLLDDEPARRTSPARGLLADPGQRQAPFGYPIRQPFESELKFFKSNPHVAGYASFDDRAVVLNPFAGEGVNLDAVAQNEAARLYMRDNDLTIASPPTEGQTRFFQGTPYEGKPDDINATAVARLFSGDPSAGVPTGDQQALAEMLRRRAQRGLLSE